MRKLTRRIIMLISATVLLSSLLLLGGCGNDDLWNGEWNREGDATFSRAKVEIYKTDGDGFYFSIQVYDGNLAGELKDYRATFRNKKKTLATYQVPETDALITFQQDDEGMNVIFSSMTLLESDVFDFELGGSITGLYVKGEVEYLNTSLTQMGVLPEQYDEVVKKMLTKAQYLRIMDCFQTSSSERNNTIAADVYYGKMTDDDYGAVVVCYDDGTVSLVLSGEKMLYFTNNSVYTADLGTYPNPIELWLREYEAEYYRRLNEEGNK